MENKKVLMFDFDGVLVDTLLPCYKINLEVNKDLTLEEYKSFFTGNIFKATRPDGTGKKRHPDFENMYETHTRELKIPPTLKNIIIELSKDYILTIVSSTHTSAIKNILKREEFLEYFSDILGADVAESKVKKIDMLLEKYSLIPENSIFITDTLGDIHEANKCGLKSIAITWGFHDFDDLKKGNPICIIDKPDLLIENIKKIIN